MKNLEDLKPTIVYEEGMYFGDISLVYKKPRNGSIVTLTDCHYAVVNSDAYEKLLKKDKLTKMEQMCTFMRQIPYLREWK